MNVDPPTWLGDDRCLELVEGGLPAAEEARQLAALPPEMRKMVELMRQDRQVLMSLGDEAAPAGMYAGVLARLEREALFEEPTEDESRLLRAELEQLATAGSGRATLAETRSLQFPPPSRQKTTAAAFGGQGRYALAAGLMLVVGGAMYMVLLGEGPTPLARSGANGTRIATSQPEPSSGTSIATNTSTDSAPASTPTLLAMDTPRSIAPEATTEVAVAPAPAVASAERSADVAAKLASATASAETTPMKPTTLGVTGPIGIEQALDLAREGRLAVRVVARDPRAVAESLAKKLNVTPDARRSWRLLPADAQTVRVATAGVATREDLLRWREWNRSYAMIAPEGTMPASTGGTDEPYDPRLDNGVYIMDATATPQAIGMVKSVVTAAAKAASPGCGVEFIEIGESSTPVNSVEGVMWWTQPSSAWVSRTSIPVVVEQK